MKNCVPWHTHWKKKEISDPRTTRCTMDTIDTTSVYQMPQGRNYVSAAQRFLGTV